jgi:hypothetical protein
LWIDNSWRLWRLWSHGSENKLFLDELIELPIEDGASSFVRPGFFKGTVRIFIWRIDHQSQFSFHIDRQRFPL